MKRYYSDEEIKKAELDAAEWHRQIMSARIQMAVTMASLVLGDASLNRRMTLEIGRCGRGLESSGRRN